VTVTSFSKLRELANQLDGMSLSSGSRGKDRRVVAAAKALGSVAVPLLGRHMLVSNGVGRHVCSDALLVVAGRSATDRHKVIVEMQRLIVDVKCDERRVEIVALLHQLGATATATAFDDPVQVKRDAALALAQQLSNAREVARAVNLMMAQLPTTELLAMVEMVVEQAPQQARWLADELLARLDLESAARANIRRITAVIRCAATPLPVEDSAVTVKALVNAHANAVIVAHSRTRSVAFLIDGGGELLDTLYEDPITPRAVASWLRLLLREGYQEVVMEFSAAQSMVVNASRRAVASNAKLKAGYYQGRDLLQLGNQHLGRLGDYEVDSARSVAAGYGIDLLAAGDPSAAYELLGQCVASDLLQAENNSELALAYGMACLETNNIADAAHWLEIASTSDPIGAEPAWNWACAAQLNGDSATMSRALQNYCERAQREPVNADVARRLDLARSILATSSSTTQISQSHE
jgi:hypothetical protein